MEAKKSKQGAWQPVLLVVGSLLLLMVSYSNMQLHRAGALQDELLPDHHGLTSSSWRESASGKLQVASGQLRQALTNFSGQASNVFHHLAARHPQPRLKSTRIFSDTSEFYELGACFAYPHLDFWGTAIVYGNQHLKDTAGECCEALEAYRAADADSLVPNVWIWCGDEERCKHMYKQCWLKYVSNIKVTKPIRTGPTVPWTVGSLKALDLRTVFASYGGLNASISWEEALDNAAAYDKQHGIQPPSEPRPFHTVTSTQGSGVEWSMRIHYYHFRKIRAQCRAQLGPACEMGGFTRLLHSGSPDRLISEVPTIVVDPLPESVIEHSRYVVLNRPYGFKKWVQIANIPERYVFMAEPDHIFIRPLPNLMKSDTPAAFPFFYIVPSDVKSVPIVKRHTGIQHAPQLDEVAPIGSSPVMMTMDDMKRVMRSWSNVSVNVYADPQAQERDSGWGWVQEMYAFAMTCWLVGIRKIDLIPEFISQPPFDPGFEERPGKPFYIIHYTYPMRFNNAGKQVSQDSEHADWVFDKRQLGGVLPRNMKEPPLNVSNNMVRALVRAFNEATDAIPCWDHYVASHGDINKDCGEEPKGWLALATAADEDAV